MNPLPSKTVTAIVARRHSDKAIGYESRIPWYIPEDLKHFREITMESDTETLHPNICIMGRVTYESLPRNHLPGRRTFVLSLHHGNSSPSELVSFFRSPEDLWRAVERYPGKNVFVCGGDMIYRLFIELCNRVIVTEVVQKSSFADIYFCDYLLSDFECHETSNIHFSERDSVPFFYKTYRRCHQEYQYLDVASRLIREGQLKDDRTGTGTLSLFGGPQLEFDLRRGFPLLTTKRVFWRGVLEELFWFISGKTDSNILSSRGIKIWEGNTSREFLDERGLKWKQGDIGPGYGFQWRHWGENYTGAGQSYRGIDQLERVLTQIRETPESRRILVSAWNVSDLDQMALPPCHILFQFNVNGRYLDLKMYQRSGDWFLGVPFNIASYATLLSLTAHLTQKTARNLIMTYGDAHLYTNHVSQMKEQISRSPLAFPELRIANRCQTSWGDILPEDVILIDYKPHPSIKAPMAV